MKIVLDALLPIVVIAINIVLGGRTGLPLFYVMAAVIAALYAAKLWRNFRGR